MSSNIEICFIFFNSNIEKLKKHILMSILQTKKSSKVPIKNNLLLALSPVNLKGCLSYICNVTHCTINGNNYGYQNIGHLKTNFPKATLRKVVSLDWWFCNNYSPKTFSMMVHNRWKLWTQMHPSKRFFQQNYDVDSLQI